MIGPDFDPVALGIVKRIKVETTELGTELLVTFWDRGSFAVRAKMGDACTIDVRPAPRPCTCNVEQLAADWAVTEANPECPMHGVVVRIGTAAEQRAAIVRALEDPRLYDAARLACFSCGLPWTDPRTGVTHLPPPSLTDGTLTKRLEGVGTRLMRWCDCGGEGCDLCASAKTVAEAALALAKTQHRPADKPQVVDDPEHDN